MLPIEVAAKGGRIMVARNNPILWLLLEVLASAPTADQIRRVLSKLLITRRGTETLEDHLRSIYATPCSNCGKTIQPLGFIWEKGGNAPVSRIYTCPQCGDEGEKNISEYDLKNLERLGNLGLHRSRALQRVSLGEEYEQESISDALDCYLQRALYICMTLVNRHDLIELSKEERILLQAVLVSVFDDANSLWHWPSREHHHFQLSVPARFLEKNLWLSLENAAEYWSQSQIKVKITYWPNMPENKGGICLYQRRLSEKESLFQAGQPAAFATIFPRPNQAFWTLSALWSGWLWGRKAVAPMRSALARRRYDWRWFAQALETALKELTKVLNPDTPLFGLLPQAAPNHFLGLLVGASSSGLTFKGYAARQAEEIIQCGWQVIATVDNHPKPNLQVIIRDFLQARGEPVSFQQIMTECLAQLAMQGNLPSDINRIEETYFSQLQQQISEILRNEHFALSFQTSSTGSSQWWLVDSRHASPPLSEQLEWEIRSILWLQPKIRIDEIDQHLCKKFKGANTPEREDVLTCLLSYADAEPDQEENYTLHKSEGEAARQSDLIEMKTILETCGRQLGFEVSVNETTTKWQDKSGRLMYVYYLTATSAISHLILNSSQTDAVKRVLVFPGSRSRWLYYRLRQDAHLAAALEEGWHFLKFRYLRWLASREKLSIEHWNELLDGDPPLWEPPTQPYLV